MSVSFNDAVVLITGASSGIGAALARELAQPFPQGYNLKTLILVARRTERLEALQSELVTASSTLAVNLQACDLTDRTATDAMLDSVLKKFGRVDVLINNAGYGVGGLYDSAPWPAIENMLQLNMISLAYLTHRLVPGMVARQRGGVLNISSGYGLVFGPGMAGYIGSKHFVTGFTEGLRVDLAGTGVTVTQVLPGPVETEFSEAMSKVSASNQRVRLPRLITISAARCAAVALRGFRLGRARIIPGFWMNVLLRLSKVVPWWMVRLPMSSKARWYRRQTPPAENESP